MAAVEVSIDATKEMMVDDDIAFVRVSGDGKTRVRTVVAYDAPVKAGEYIYSMYRLADKATNRVATDTLNFSYYLNGTHMAVNAQRPVSVLNQSNLDGWVIASVNLEQRIAVSAKDRLGRFTFMFEHTDALDIAFVIVGTDNDSIRNVVVPYGGQYWYCGTFFNEQSGSTLRKRKEDGSW